ncbi:MAG: penicillin-insensitive murein endopeptidase [Myxococcales bacterium]|nr:penicillin-insensitive murein endopeptidase [Myxococcales bacterium]
MVTKLRSLVLLTPMLVCTGRVTAEPLHEVPRPVIGVAELPLEVVSELPPEEEQEVEPELALVDAELHEVYWTVDVDESIDGVASRWGLLERDLVRLNPQLRGRDQVTAGSRLRVFEHDEATPTQSVGSPNKGRLRHGLPMPEGPYWKLRDRRTRTFGTDNAIRAMITAFTRYGQSFEGAPPVSVGEISYRRGGRALPHRSHRTGRDVDLGYILHAAPEGKHWKRADAENFDVEKNWALIRALVETGEVQQIFISSRLQHLLRPVARQELSPEEFGRYFYVPGQEPEHSPILKHWDGHRDHMHVRFRCEDGNSRCRSRSSHAHAPHSA